MRKLILLLAALAPTACGYAPSRDTNTAAPQYHTDLEACETASATTVNQNNAKRGLTWLASPATRWTRIDDATSACMTAKGWGQTRACTPEELRAGNRTPSLLVTAAGVRCSDPPTAARPADTSPPAGSKQAPAVAKQPR